MKFKGQVVATYSTVIEAKGWRSAKAKARKKFMAEKDLGKPKNGTIAIGQLEATDKEWI